MDFQSMAERFRRKPVAGVATNDGEGEYAVRYRPGSGMSTAINEKTFKTEAEMEKFIDKIVEGDGEIVSVRLARSHKTEPRS